MQVDNFLQMNDWKIGKLFFLIFIFQIAVIFLFSLSLVGMNIAIIREIICFFYLFLIPGSLILRILRLHKLGTTQTALFTVGLSILSLMLIGIFMNTFIPIFGVTEPLSSVNLIIIISLSIFLLCIFAYLRDKKFSHPSYIDTKDLTSPIFLFLCLIPFLAIFGTYLMNINNNAIISILLILIISLIVIWSAFGKIPKKFYPLTVFTITIAILYHSSLISTQIWGWDIQIEYYLANLVLQNSFWNHNSAALYLNSWYNFTNSMLSFVILAPIFSKISGMALTSIFKIIYPLLFSLVPLGLYEIFQKQTNKKIALMSCFFFIFFYGFFMELPALARQEIAEIFIILLILVLISKINVDKRRILFILFSIGLIVSHYSIAFFYLALLIGGLIMLFLIDIPQKIYKSEISHDNEKKISLYQVIFFTMTMIVIYILLSGSIIIDTLVGIGGRFIGIISLYLLETVIFSILILIIVLLFGILKKRWNVRSKVYNFILLILFVFLFLIFLINPINLEIMINLGYLQLSMVIVMFFITIGISISTIQFMKIGFKKEYLVMSITSYLILLFGIMFPSFADLLNLSRFYQLTFIFLAPFCVIGGIKTYGAIFNVLKPRSNDSSIPYELFSIFLVIFLFFQTSLIIKIIPFIAYSFVSQLIIIFLAPFLIIGCLKFFESIKSKTKLNSGIKTRYPNNKNNLIVLTIFLIILIFLAINIPYINRIGLSPHGSFQINGYEDSPTFNYPETEGVNWLSKNMIKSKNPNDDPSIYVDDYGELLLYSTLGPDDVKTITDPFKNIDYWKNSYLFLRESNIQSNTISIIINKNLKYIPLSRIVNDKNLIYSNGDSSIYYTPED